jgi:hypothetical protein
MKTKQIISNGRAGMRVLLLSSMILLSGCSKDVLNDSGNSSGNTDEELPHHVEHFDYNKRSVAFDEFQKKLSALYQKQGVYGKAPEDLSFILDNNYIVAIDTTRIVEFEREGLTTYTFHVRTINESPNSFTNLIYIENDEGFSYGLVRYTPSSTWLIAMQNGESIAFDGAINLIDSYGNVIDTNVTAGKSSSSMEGKGLPPCIFSAEPIIQACYGSACPCTDGNGTIIGWEFTISCSNWEGGSSGSGGTSGGGNGGGNGGSGTGMDLPTDPIAWAIMTNLNELKGPNDFFYFDPDINANNGLVFNTYQDFENEFNGFGLGNVVVINNQDGTHTTHYGFDTGLATVNVFVEQTLKNPATNEDYLVHSIVTTLSGFTLGKIWQVSQTNININQNNNRATIDVYGTLSYDSFIEGFGVYYNRFFHLVLEINMLTGQSMGVSILEN